MTKGTRHAGSPMFRKLVLGCLASLALSASVSASVASGNPATPPSDVRVTENSRPGAYQRQDGGSDPVMALCSTGRRGQAEPTVAVDPHNPDIIVTGATDHCGVYDHSVPNLAWPGVYRSTDGGRTWAHSLLPGYPGDTSFVGTHSPLRPNCNHTADPSMDFDVNGRLYFVFMCVHDTEPGSVRIWVATYDHDGATYAGVVEAVPHANTGPVNVYFDDAPKLAVDRSDGPRRGAVYVTWSRLYITQEAGQATPDIQNQIEVIRSDDQGMHFSAPVGAAVPADPGTPEEPYIAIGPRGEVYVTFREYLPGRSQFWIARSTDGGTTFALHLLRLFNPFDSSNFGTTTFVFGPGGCGEGPYACVGQPGPFTVARWTSRAAVSADSSGVHVVWNELAPSGQSKVVVVNSPDGLAWDSPIPVDTQPRGHQWMPAITSSGGITTVLFYDSRIDRAYAPSLPPGNDAAGQNSGPAAEAFIAQSRDGGRSWAERLVSSKPFNPNWEIAGDQRVPWIGDYIYVASAGSKFFAVWTDLRDVVAGKDPRVPADITGFDVLAPCAYAPNDINASPQPLGPGQVPQDSYSAPAYNDDCLGKGGLDSKIYGAGGDTTIPSAGSSPGTVLRPSPPGGLPNTST